jgi:trehalose synthase
MRDLGARVIWNCHIGADEANDDTRLAWRFLLPSVTKSDAQVFSRRQYVWEGLGEDEVEIIAPCIDAFSPKNQDLTRDQVDSILAATGIVDAVSGGEAGFVRPDGSAGRVRSNTHMIESAPVPPGAPIVTQVSRWDPLKDHSGLALGFEMGVPSDLGAHLVLAGPDPEAVADDPEGQATLEDLRSCVEALPDQARDRTHIACLPMGDNDENAAIVNALQRYSTIVVQKSLAEGFGLTVAEAMWKARPTVASAVGGIQDQIVDSESGILIDDPEDIEAIAGAISALLVDKPAAERLGAGARRAVVEHQLAPSYIRRYLDLVERVLEG